MKLRRIRVGKGVIAITAGTCCLLGAEDVQLWFQHGSVTTLSVVSLVILVIMTLSLIFFRAKDQ